MEKIAFQDNGNGTARIIFSGGYQLTGYSVEKTKQLYDSMVKNKLFSLSDIKKFNYRVYLNVIGYFDEMFIGDYASKAIEKIEQTTGNVYCKEI